jgi:biotin carboxylase
VSDAAPRLLVLGAGREALPVLGALKRAGCQVVVADGVPDAPGFRVADAGLLASTFDAEAIVDAARAYASQTRIDGVLGTARRVSTAVAAVADALGLPGTSPDAARWVADRLALKTRLRAGGVAVPWSASARGPSAIRQIAAAARDPLVVKPVDGWAARGVVRLLDGVDFAWAHRVALVSSPSGRVMVEAFTHGIRLSIVSLVAGGTPVTVDVAERSCEAHERFAPFAIDAGHERPAILAPADGVAVDALLQRAVAVLGLGDGVMTTEVVLSRRGPVLADLELGLTDGRRLVHEIPLASGVDVVGAAVRLASGRPPAPAEVAPRWLRPVAERAIFSPPGVVVSVRDADRAAELDGVTLVDVLVGPGSRVLPPTSNLCHGGAVVAVGQDRDEAIARATAAAARICIVTTSDASARPSAH